ncbi:ADPribosylglycohydrolase superfamily protein [Pelomyxa schiedti]|nr:ADPribosylglycohydrolase superfamily protein [Pelomyxa schiedti]
MAAHTPNHDDVVVGGHGDGEIMEVIPEGVLGSPAVTGSLPLSPVDRAVGVIMTSMIGDCLGATVEGWGADQIHERYPSGLRNFYYAAHMGVYNLGLRRGVYTDDTQSALALAWSMVQKGGLDPGHCARAYAEFYRHVPKRGYPASAISVLRAVEAGEDWHNTGRKVFADGSFANGGAMRIAPVGVAFRNASDTQLYEAVRYAIMSSHVHPQAVDGAFITAKAITVLQRTTAAEVNVSALLNELKGLCRTDEMRNNIQTVIENLDKGSSFSFKEEIRFVEKLGGDFQIAAVEAVAVVLWGFARYYKDPENCLIKVVGFGGDTDTTACICGGLLGALHGTSWIPQRWWQWLRNDEWGRDWAVDLAQKLVLLDLTEPLST